MASRNYRKNKKWFKTFKRGNKIKGDFVESRPKHLPFGATMTKIDQRDWTTKYGKWTQNYKFKISKFKERGLIKQNLNKEI